MSDVQIAVTDWLAGPFELPAGHTEFAIGDSHGHADQLAALLDAGRDLGPDAALNPAGQPHGPRPGQPRLPAHRHRRRARVPRGARRR